MQKPVPFKKIRQAFLSVRPFAGKRLSKERLNEISARTGLSQRLVREIDKRANARWLVHRTKREFLQQILSRGLVPAHAPTRNPEWFLVNQIFDRVKPRGISIARTRANYFSAREIVQQELFKEGFFLSSDFRGWFSKKDIESIDFTRVKARLDVRKAMVFDEAMVDTALELFRGFHEKTGTRIVSMQQAPKELRESITRIAKDYWRKGMSFQEFESHYILDKARNIMVKKPNAPARLPKIIERPEILYPSRVAQRDVKEVTDSYNEQVKELRKEFGIE